MIEGTLRIIGYYITTKVSYSYTNYEDFLRIVLDFRGQKGVVLSNISPLVALLLEELKADITCLLIGRDKKLRHYNTFYIKSYFARWNTYIVLKPSLK